METSLLTIILMLVVSTNGDICDSFCHNGGTCTIENNEPKCRCPTYYVGPKCQDCGLLNPAPGELVFTCDNGKCIPQLAICDIGDTCGDHSDESPNICANACPEGFNRKNGYRCTDEGNDCGSFEMHKDITKEECGQKCLTNPKTKCRSFMYSNVNRVCHLYEVVDDTGSPVPDPWTQTPIQIFCIKSTECFDIDSKNSGCRGCNCNFGGDVCRRFKQDNCKKTCGHCIATNCQWDNWVTGECSKACGTGTRTNTRTKLVEEADGGSCTGQSTQIEQCNTQDCVPVDCKWSDWEIGDCSVECGGGLQPRFRKKTQEALYGGACEGEETDLVECNPDPCPVIIACPKEKSAYCSGYVYYYPQLCKDTPRNQWFLGEDGRYACRKSCGLC